MRFIKTGMVWIIFFFFLTAFLVEKNEWGFFAHRRINRLAVFTLHHDLIAFYKKHIEFVTAHAIDPDKRRYVIPTEGYKHFIDLDHWKKEPLPKFFRDTRQRFAEVVIINNNKDTLRLFGRNVKQLNKWNVLLEGANFPVFFGKKSIILLKEEVDSFFQNQIYIPQYVDKWKLNCDSLQAFFDFHGFDLDCQKAYAVDTLVQHGVLPYNLIRMQKALTRAMVEKNLKQILRISADLGHYIGDAHVPLHTHSNYNGQKTDQIGIHAFWETRLPEMFADEQYDFFVGKATYIDDIETHYWKIVNESHALVNDVLSIEKELSKIFPADQQDCFIERGEGYIQKMACEEYAKIYHKELNGQVEQRFRKAIKAVGDAWFTAWVDAGQPDLLKIADNRNRKSEKEASENLEKATKTNNILGRKH